MKTKALIKYEITIRICDDSACYAYFKTKILGGHWYVSRTDKELCHLYGKFNSGVFILGKGVFCVKPFLENL